MSSSCARRAMPSFEVTVELPFRREDVWAEIHGEGARHKQELGVPESVSTEIDGPIRIGCTRKVTVSNDDGSLGTVRSKLVELSMGYSTRWQIVEQTNSQFNLLAPAFTSLMLTEYPSKTAITLGYSFSGISVAPTAGGSPPVDPAAELRERIATNKGSWTEDMTRRGYKPIPRPSEESGEAAGTRVTPAGGFAIVFHLPFHRSDVFKESALVSNPLGTEADDQISYAVVGQHPKPQAAHRVALGLKRKVDFVGPSAGQKGVVVSTLTELVEDARMTWAQDSSECDYINFEGEKPSAGRDGRPLFTLDFSDDDVSGTRVTLTYEFARIVLGRGGGGLLGCLMPCCYGASTVRCLSAVDPSLANSPAAEPTSSRLSRAQKTVARPRAMQVRADLIRRVSANCAGSWGDAMRQRGYASLRPGESASSAASGAASGATTGVSASARPSSTPSIDSASYGPLTFTFSDNTPLGLHVAMRGTKPQQVRAVGAPPCHRSLTSAACTSLSFLLLLCVAVRKRKSRPLGAAPARTATLLLTLGALSRLSSHSQLYVDEVTTGSQAAQLCVPTKAQITAIDGDSMVAPKLWEALQSKSRQRPLSISVYVEPPEGMLTSPSKKASLRNLLSRNKSGKAPTPTK